MSIITKINNKLFNNIQEIYMTFICPSEFPYINPTLI